jgi:uncharacterized membrane protein HdeD (DUF308 family)
MHTPVLVSQIKHSVAWLITLGILLLVLGVVCIVSPLVSGMAVELLVGGVMLVAGVAKLFHAGRARSWGSGMGEFLLGMFTALAGLLLLAHPLAGLAFLTLLLAGFFFLEGIAQFVIAFRLRPLAGWLWVLFGGLLSFLLAVLIYVNWPLSGAWAVGTLVGIQILYNGWSLIAIGLAVRNDLRY